MNLFMYTEGNLCMFQQGILCYWFEMSENEQNCKQFLNLTYDITNVSKCQFPAIMEVVGQLQVKGSHTTVHAPLCSLWRETGFLLK